MYDIKFTHIKTNSVLHFEISSLYLMSVLIFTYLSGKERSDSNEKYPKEDTIHLSVMDTKLTSPT